MARGVHRMTETTQLVLGLSAAMLPTLSVLVGIPINRNDTTRLDTRISDLEVSLGGEISGLEASLRGEMAAMRAQSHSDVLMHMGSDKEQDARITRLENR